MANPGKIIIADDDAGIVDAIQIMLKFEGYDVYATADESTLGDIREQQPDLVLLDIWMSGHNGTEICKTLKADKATSRIPVILISASSNIRDSACKCGADDFLEKPFEMEDLIKKVKSLLVR